MNFLTFFKKLRNVLLKFKSFLMKILKKKQPKISIIIPFSSTDPYRQANFKWLLEYWKRELPDAEIIVGTSDSEIFCKGEALNNAVLKSKGKILAIVDADAYIRGSVLTECADNMLADPKANLWYVPYRKLYRLTEDASRQVILSDPSNPHRFPLPISSDMIENSGLSINYGHRYGAMLTMFPREAYDLIGGFDERFKGWGAEDICWLFALNTLYGKYKTSNNEIYHLWHPVYGKNLVERRWVGQTSGNVNSNLGMQYRRAYGNPVKMKAIVDAAKEYRGKLK
jgi:hypothetical protein